MQNQSITNQNIYFFTYKDIVLIYKKYPDFIFHRNLFLKSYSSYCFVGSKTYLINPRNPKHFITDVTNTKEVIEYNKKMNEAFKFLKRTNYPYSRDFTLSKDYDNKEFINKNPLLGTLTYEQFLRVYEVVPDVYSLDYLFSNQKETYIKIYNLIFIINPLNKDEFITKTSITSFDLPKNNTTQKDYYIYQFISDIERRTVQIYIDKCEYYKLMYYFNEDQKKRENRTKKYLHKIRYQKTRQLLKRIRELEEELKVKINSKKNLFNEDIQYRINLIDKIIQKNGKATTKDIQKEYQKKRKEITINPDILDTIEKDMKRYIKYTPNVKLSGGRGRGHMLIIEYNYKQK